MKADRNTVNNVDEILNKILCSFDSCSNNNCEHFKNKFND